MQNNTGMRMKQIRYNHLMNFVFSVMAYRIYTLVFISGIILFSGCSDNINEIPSFENDIILATSLGKEATLGSLTDFEWDKLDIIGPYSTDFDYDSITGIPKKVRSAIKSKEMFDGTGVLVFSLKGEYVAYAEVGT